MNTGIMKKFNQLCTKRGFKKSGKVYSRCIGEGVYQNITLGATEYRTISKREPIVGFNFVSMYSNLSPYHFSNRKWEMQFYAENLIGESFTGMYAGLPEEKLPKSYEEEIEIMMGVGLDYLDGIQTSRDVIKRTEELQIIQNGRIRSGNAVLCGPYLMCNEGENAFSIAARVYAKNWDAFHSNYDRLRKEGHYEEYVQPANKKSRLN